MRQNTRHAREPSERIPRIGIGRLLRRAHIAFSRELRSQLAAYGLTFGEFVHLEKLWYEDGLNQTEISRRVGIKTASSTGVLDLLEKRGYVRRVRNGVDRRNLNVFLNPSGAALRDKLLACAEAVNRQARDGLRDRDVVTFFSLMEKIAANLEKPGKLRAGQRRRQRSKHVTRTRRRKLD